MTNKPGRKKGGINKGSLPWQLQKLEKGDCVLLPYDSQGGMPGIELSIQRAVEKGVLFDVYKVQTCYGHTADFSELPFRFFKITRVE